MENKKNYENEKEICEICEKKFIFAINRKHKCKRCKRNICSLCGKSKEIIIDYDKQGKHRLCDICKEETDYLKSFRSLNQIKWNFNSKIACKWMNYLHLNDKMNISQFSYSYYLKEFSNEEKLTMLKQNQFNTQIDNIMNLIIQNLNYSFKEFYILIQDSYLLEDCNINIKNVLKALISKDKNFEISENSVLIISFLLCFCCEEIVFWIFEILKTELFDDNFFRLDSDEYFNEEIKIVENINKTLKIYSKEELSTKFFENFTKLFLNNCFINIINIQICYFIWDSMLSKGTYLEMEKALICIMKINIPKIEHIIDEKKESLNMILMNTTFNYFRKELNFEISTELRMKFTSIQIKQIKSTHLRNKQNTLIIGKNYSNETNQNEEKNMNKEIKHGILLKKALSNDNINNKNMIETIKKQSTPSTDNKSNENEEESENLINNLKKDKDLLNKILEEKDQFINRLINEKNNKLNLDSNNSTITKIQNIEKQKQNFQKDLTKAKKEITEKEVQIKSLKDKINTLQKIIESQTETLEEIQKKEPFYAENKALRLEISELEERIESLMAKIERQIVEKQEILEQQLLNEDKYEKIIFAMEEENTINKEKCKTLHNNYNIMHENSNFKFHTCEKAIEIKIAEVKNLKEKLVLTSSKIQETEANFNKVTENVLDQKNQEIVNLKIDLESMQTKLLEQNTELNNLKKIHTDKINNFDKLLEEKEEKIHKLKQNFRTIEEQLNDQKLKTELINEKQVECIHHAEEKVLERKLINDNNVIEEIKSENDSLKKKIKITQKSLKEIQELNSVFSKDLQKIKHKHLIEIEQKDQEILKLRQTLSMYENLEKKNNQVNEIMIFQKEKVNKTDDSEYLLNARKSVVEYNQQKQNQFEPDEEITGNQEICKVCVIF